MDANQPEVRKYTGYKPNRKLPIIIVAVLLIAAVLGVLSFTVGDGALFPMVPPGHIAILTRKTGRALPPGMVVAPRVAEGEEPYQGVQERVLTPGWYPTGYDPYNWNWQSVPHTHVPSGFVGVLVRLYGEDMPPGQSLADENPADEANGILRKGILRKTLEPGYHLVNTLAYDVIIYPKVTIEPGEVGVVTHQIGVQPKDLAAFLSEPGERGVQRVALPPGSHYLNPYVDSVLPITRQSQRLDLAQFGRLKFPSNDGFEITLDGTVEWSLIDEMLPLVYVKFGDAEEASHKLILPAARAMSRLQGSRKPAREFISGTTRQTFQDDFARDLRKAVEAEGLRVHSVLVSGIEPPEDIALPIRERETSLLEREQYQKQMESERSRAELARQSEIEKRPKSISEARTQNVTIITQARQARETRLIEAQRDLDVAAFRREAAVNQAEGIVAKGAAESEIQRLKLFAEAESLQKRIAAYGGGSAFAKTMLYEKLAPQYSSIFANTDGPLADIFREVLQIGTHPTRTTNAPSGGQR
jgi:hypothetical protein